MGQGRSRIWEVHKRDLGHAYGTGGRSRLWDREVTIMGRDCAGVGRRSGWVGRSRLWDGTEGGPFKKGFQGATRPRPVSEKRVKKR